MAVRCGDEERVRVDCAPSRFGEYRTLGRGAKFPASGRSTWQWGAEEQQIAETIRLGRQGMMPGWLAAVGEQGVEQLTDHVLALSGGSASTTAAAEGGALYQQFCIACHAPDGSGNPLLGAPALNDRIWTYGGERADVVESIANGRNGTMPAFAGRLDDTQIRLLLAWLKAGAETPYERGLSLVEQP